MNGQDARAGDPSLAAAALAMAGVRFRLHGRDPAHGLDCVGLVAAAMEACGSAPPVPRGYAVRMRSLDRCRQWAMAAKLAELPAASPPMEGEIRLVQPHPLHLHLCILAAGGLVHADSRAGRVVALDGPMPWPTLIRWVRKGAC